MRHPLQSERVLFSWLVFFFFPCGRRQAYQLCTCTSKHGKLRRSVLHCNTTCSLGPVHQYFLSPKTTLPKLQTEQKKSDNSTLLCQDFKRKFSNFSKVFLSFPKEPRKIDFLLLLTCVLFSLQAKGQGRRAQS